MSVKSSTSSPMVTQTEWRVIYCLGVISVRPALQPTPFVGDFVFSLVAPHGYLPRSLFPPGFIHFRSSCRWRLKVGFLSLTAKSSLARIASAILSSILPRVLFSVASLISVFPPFEQVRASQLRRRQTRGKIVRSAWNVPSRSRKGNLYQPPSETNNFPSLRENGFCFLVAVRRLLLDACFNIYTDLSSEKNLWRDEFLAVVVASVRGETIRKCYFRKLKVRCNLLLFNLFNVAF